MQSIYSHCRNALRSPLRLASLVAFLLTGVNSAFAAQAQLAWDANPSPEVAGYMIHYGQSKAKYTAQIDVGKATKYTVPELTAGQTYYFAVTAYDAARVESGYSNEINQSVPENAAATEVITQSTNGSTSPSTPTPTPTPTPTSTSTSTPTSSNTNNDAVPAGTTETPGTSSSPAASNGDGGTSGSPTASNGSGGGNGGGGGGCTITTGPADFSLPLLAGFALLGLRLRPNLRRQQPRRAQGQRVGHIK